MGTVLDFKIAPHREQDVRTPRTQSRQMAKTPWESRTEGLPRPLWQPLAGFLGLIVLVSLLLYAVPSPASILHWWP